MLVLKGSKLLSVRKQLRNRLLTSFSLFLQVSSLTLDNLPNVAYMYVAIVCAIVCAACSSLMKSKISRWTQYLMTFAYW